MLTPVGSRVPEAKNMAEVLVQLRIMPQDVGIDLDAVVERIKGLRLAKFQGAEREPIAFGLEALRSTFVVNDEAGATDRLEEAVKNIEGVGGVEVLAASRLL